MAVRYVYRRRKPSRGLCVFSGWFSAVIGAIITLSPILVFFKGAIPGMTLGSMAFSVLIFGLLSIPAPLYFFLKAKALDEEAARHRADLARAYDRRKEAEAALQAQKAAELAQKELLRQEAALEKQENERRMAQMNLIREEQIRIVRENPRLAAARSFQKENAGIRDVISMSRSVILSETCFRDNVPFKITCGETQMFTEGFVVENLNGTLHCCPKAQARGQVLGEFDYLCHMWFFTHQASSKIQMGFTGRHPLDPGETVEVLPYPNTGLTITGPGIQGEILIEQGWH